MAEKTQIPIPNLHPDDDAINNNNPLQNHDVVKEEAVKEKEKDPWKSLVEEGIHEITAYQFKNPNLLHQAFTHHTFLDQDKHSKDSYDRLEYIGDAVIGIFAARDHFFNYPDLPAGQLTKLRSANVDTEKLARAALRHRLHRFLRHKKPVLEEQIKQFEEAIVSHPVHSFGLIEAPKTLADIVESLVGAVHTDCDSMDIAFKVVEKLLQPMITPETLNTNPVTKLYEICQKHRVSVESKDLWKESGVIEFFVDGEFAGRATYKGKRDIASNRAALDAYKKVVAILKEKNNKMKQVDTD